MWWREIKKSFLRKEHNRRGPLVGVEHLPLVRVLEHHWHEIREECERMPKDFRVPWVIDDDYAGVWNVVPIVDRERFTFTAVPKDMLLRNRAAVPKTIAVLDRFPEIVSCGFSILYPAAVIHPHKDAEYGGGEITRIHLALDIPDDSAIAFFREETQKWEEASWQEGKCFAFDGSFLHRAWNYGPRERVVLILDILARYPLKETYGVRKT